MTFKEKNIVVTLVNFTLILGFFLIRIFQLVQNESFTSENVFRLWGIIIGFAVFITIAATILTQIVSAVIEAVRTGKEEPEIDSLEDERDKLIDLRGTKVTYFVTSIGGLIAMLTFVLGQPPLVMFTLLILFGVLAQIVGDIFRLALYRGGF